MLSEIGKVWALLTGVRNPVPAVLDRVGLRRAPYTLRLHDGAVVELRPRTGDLFGFYEIMLRRDYINAGQRLSVGETVVDVGANIGCFTVLAAQIVGPTGRVFAIEPEASTYRQLLRNIELNRLTNVTPLQMAIGANEGAVTLHADSNCLFSSVFSSVNGRLVTGTDQQVRMTTLEWLIDTYQIACCDYLKLDCEGAEHEIIGKLSQPTADRIVQITMEVHKIPGFEGRALGSRLETLGYRRIGASTLPFYARSPESPEPFNAKLSRLAGY